MMMMMMMIDNNDTSLSLNTFQQKLETYLFVQWRTAAAETTTFYCHNVSLSDRHLLHL